jgi:ABC-type transport system involved in multi-copper enzyme maturation permease subunit
MNVIHLIAKDLRLQRSFFLPLVLMELAGYLAYALQMPSHIPGVAFGLLHGVAFIGDFLICYRTMIAEEKHRALMFIKTLPVSTREIVMAKFGANLLLVTLNTGVMLALWGTGRGLGWIQVRPSLTVYLVLAGLTVHLLNNAFFVAVALAFTSESAVWVPFPFLFVLMSVMINFPRIKAALNLQGAVDLVQRHDLLAIALLWAMIVAFAAACTWILGHKKVFA